MKGFDIFKWLYFLLCLIPAFFILTRKEVIEYLKPGLSDSRKKMNRRDLQMLIFFVLIHFMIGTEFLFQTVYSDGAWLAIGGLMGTNIIKDGFVERQINRNNQ